MRPSLRIKLRRAGVFFCVKVCEIKSTGNKVREGGDRMSKRFRSKEMRALVEQHLDSGVSLSYVADMFGVSYNDVSSVLSEEYSSVFVEREKLTHTNTKNSETGKAKVFERIDQLIDRGVDVSNISRELPAKEYDSLRKQAARAFGSYAQALAEYGINDTNGTPADVELARCFDITDNYEVVTLPNADHVRDIYNLDELTFRRIAKPQVEELELDALDNFYRDHFPFDKYPTANLREKLPVLYGYLRKHYGTYKRFLRAYGVDYRYIERDYGGRESIAQGHVFEQKLGAILDAIYSEVQRHVRIGPCIPDFIVNGAEWIDAKLSAKSILDPRCTTAEKYAEETSHVTVYYARGKRQPYTHGIAEVIHVSSLYPKLLAAGRADLIADMEAFIARISYGEEANAA